MPSAEFFPEDSSLVVLTAQEQKALNDISMARDTEVKLGDKAQFLINYLREKIVSGTPANAQAASGMLSISGVVSHGESVRINNPAAEGYDLYEFLADEAQSKTDPGYIAVDITDYVSFAEGTLTMDTQPISGDTVTIGGKTYIFVPVGTDTADGEVSVGAALADAQANLVAAINGTDGISDPHPLVRAGNFALDICTITALVGGANGNSIPTTETFTAETNVFTAVVLGNGADCSAIDAAEALVNAIAANDSQGVEASDDSGDVQLAAVLAGEAGNAITIETAMTNGSFAGLTLDGGEDGTPADGLTIMADDTYLYICFLTNTVSGRNWRRIELGDAFDASVVPEGGSN